MSDAAGLANRGPALLPSGDQRRIIRDGRRRDGFRFGWGASNVFFGGPDLQWLYVTDGDKLYRRQVKRRGAVLRRADSKKSKPPGRADPHL